MYTRGYWHYTPFGFQQQFKFQTPNQMDSFNRQIETTVSGELLRAFDDYCVKNNLTEPDGLRECFRIYLKKVKEGYTVKVNFFDKKKDVEKQISRRILTTFSGMMLKEFDKNRHGLIFSGAELLREAIRVTTNFKNDKGNQP